MSDAKPMLVCDHVSIRYRVGDFKAIGLKEWFTRRLTGNYRVRDFWADRDVSFTLNQGDMLGIIGTNGAGKSTLLKAISGIMEPTRGHVTRHGRIAALLELASGFDGDLTVKENAYLRGAMLGYTRAFMDKTYRYIIEFSELKEFEDRPFKQLSSGMKSRLAFSIASLVRPDILILDEVLSVGDGAFAAKSAAKMREIIRSGATTILVSHTLGQVRQLCNKVLWLHKGRQIAFTDDVAGVCDCYAEFLKKGGDPVFDTEAAAARRKASECVRLVLSANEGYLPYVKVAVYSVLLHARKKPVEIVITHYDIPARAQEAFLKSLTLPPGIRIRFASVKDFIDRTDLLKAKTSDRFPAEVLYRLALPQLIPDADKLVFLDADTIVRADIADLFDVDLKGAWIAAVRGAGFIKWVGEDQAKLKWYADHGITDISAYFNAGIVVLNARAFRENNLLPKLIACAVSSPYFPDQDALNIICNGRVRYLDLRWNVCVRHFLRRSKEASGAEFRRALEDAYILHYNSKEKPWDNPGGALAKIWWKYAEGIPIPELLKKSRNP